jgi:hypothetical protein
VGRGFGVGATVHGLAVAALGSPELCAVQELPLVAVHAFPPPEPHEPPLEPLLEHERPPPPPPVLHEPPCGPLALHEFPLSWA